MFKNLCLLDVLTLFLIYYLVIPPPAHAYFDLGVGAYMLQLVFGFGAAFWLSLKSKMMRKYKARKTADQSDPVVSEEEEEEKEPEPAAPPADNTAE
ncbi:MAG TPA: hypothetical protein V6C81_04110 [Planktothrix sp.]|jgi:hypothetical protein